MARTDPRLAGKYEKLIDRLAGIFPLPSRRGKFSATMLPLKFSTYRKGEKYILSQANRRTCGNGRAINL